LPRHDGVTSRYVQRRSRLTRSIKRAARRSEERVISAFEQLLTAMLVAALLSACSARAVELPPCWQPAQLQQGSRFYGEAVLMGASDIRPLMSPFRCEGTSVIANLPTGSLGSRRGMNETEPVFYRARVEGFVDGVAYGRPMVTLTTVEHVVRVKPSWLKSV
jgi:hypothetical protein